MGQHWTYVDLKTQLYFLAHLDIFIVLLESPFDPLRRNMNSVLLTVDLTKAVADEAIERNDSMIVAYRA